MQIVLDSEFHQDRIYRDFRPGAFHAGWPCRPPIRRWEPRLRAGRREAATRDAIDRGIMDDDLLNKKRRF
jgi:hypothetical protein